ncbi:MAG TPA: hypothetical protein VJR47_22545 [Stellaceae bacterium]|nr:hypothetical protein [Stellaceae bacterium]
MTEGCAAPIPFAMLIEYWCGEIDGAAEARIEEHFLGCASCSARLDALAALAQGVRAAFAQGAVHAAISAPFLDEMKRQGLRVREYPVAPGESVHCTVAASDDAVISRLKASLAGIARLDLVSMNERGELRYRLEDIPFDPEAGEVLFCPATAALKGHPAYIDHFRLLAVGADGERAVGDYTFIHTPS